MRRIGSTERLTMLFALLLLIFVIFVLQGCTFRQALFERSTKAWAQKPLYYAETSACEECHSPILSQWSQSEHAGVSCENCHGSGVAHIEKAEVLTINRNSSFCLMCHEKLVSRPSDFPQVASATHSDGLTCITCHNPHAPSIGTAAPATPDSTPGASATASGPPLIPHTLEGRANCLACHGPQGFKPFPLAHAGRTNQTCLVCHK